MNGTYICWVFDDEEEPDASSVAHQQEASTAEWAAEDYVERTDHHRDHAAMEDEGTVIAVRDPDGALSHWRVCGVQSVDYTANPYTVEDKA